MVKEWLHLKNGKNLTTSNMKSIFYKDRILRLKMLSIYSIKVEDLKMRCKEWECKIWLSKRNSFINLEKLLISGF
jgi:predicted DNA-binding transcriptional regulator